MSNTLIVSPATKRIVVTQAGVKIISVGVMGPPGPAGDSTPWQEDTFVLSGNQTVFALSDTPQTGSVQMFVNGLRQSIANFSLAGSTITVTGFTPTTEDEVSFIYQAEV